MKNDEALDMKETMMCVQLMFADARQRNAGIRSLWVEQEDGGACGSCDLTIFPEHLGLSEDGAIAAVKKFYSQTDRDTETVLFLHLDDKAGAPAINGTTARTIIDDDGQLVQQKDRKPTIVLKGGEI